MVEALAIFQNIGMMELLIIVLVVVLLFGSTKIPQLMRGFGSGINEFKKGLKEGEKEAVDEAKAAKDSAAKPEESKPAEADKK
jgi:sec-independent protein translocase protein TatA